VKWLSSRFAGAASHDTIDGIEIYRAGGEYTVYAAAPIVYVRHMRDCDVLLDAENGIPFFVPLYSTLPAALLMFHVHRDVLLRELPPPLNWFTWALEVWLMPLVYRRVPFIAISESTRDDILANRYTKLPVTLIHSGVDHNALWPSEKAAVPSIVYLGRIVRYKRIRELLEVFARVRKSVPNATLRIAGTGSDLAACQDLAQNAKFGDSVFFEGFIGEDRKRELLASAWVFAQPSRVEGWGISVIEAAACGTAAVAMRVPGLQDAIVDGETGRLVRTWDEFADALTYILANDPYRARLSENALRRSQQFSWKSSADRLLEKLQEIAQTGLS
jgi:glycosyltransferase involved in cell wall biosynthesis